MTVILKFDLLEIYSWLNNSGHAKNHLITSLTFFFTQNFLFLLLALFIHFVFDDERKKNQTQKIDDLIESYYCRNKKKNSEKRKKNSYQFHWITTVAVARNRFLIIKSLRWMTTESRLVEGILMFLIAYKHIFTIKKNPNEKDFFMYQIELMMFMRWRLSADQKFSLPFGLFDLIL